MSEPSITVGGVSVPRFLYGTAWKEEATQRLVGLAIAAGFRGLDTANQRKHYHEAAVGAAILDAFRDHTVRLQREDLFIQTKFTFRGGQDHRLPYDPRAPVAAQVEQSFARSLEHLGVDVVDSLLLHGPSQSVGLSTHDWQAWRAMEALHDKGQSRLLGVSNFQRDQLELLVGNARVKPHFVQNRCFARTAWDRDIREFCADHAVVYQAFSLLTANREVLARPEVAATARRHQRTIPQIIFRFAVQVGMIPLTGTTDRTHMREDLEIFDFQLDDSEVHQLEHIAVIRP